MSSITFTYDDGYDGLGDQSRIRKIIATWTSDSTAAFNATTRKITGYVVKGVTDPGSPAPTNNYDIALTDPEGVDILGSFDTNLTNRSSTTTQEVYFSLLSGAIPLYRAPTVCDPITVTISNAGSGKAGELILYYETHETYG